MSEVWARTCLWHAFLALVILLIILVEVKLQRSLIHACCFLLFTPELGDADLNSMKMLQRVRKLETTGQTFASRMLKDLPVFGEHSVVAELVGYHPACL